MAESPGLPSFLTMAGRAIRRRCPHCSAKAFSSWFTMHQICPGCGLKFERESGYWVGAVTINTTVTFLSFVTVFTAMTFASWPDVAWGMVMGGTVAVNLLVPIVFYPLSKTLWAAMEISWRPLEPQDFPHLSE